MVISLYPTLDGDRQRVWCIALPDTVCSLCAIIVRIGTRDLIFDCLKLVIATAYKSPQQPVALIVSHDRGVESEEIRSLFGCEGRNTGVAAPSSVSDTSLSLVTSGLDWCHSFLCRSFVDIAWDEYPVTREWPQTILSGALLVSGADFLLRNDLVGGRVWVQPPSADNVPYVEAVKDYDYGNVITCSVARRVEPSITSGVDCNKTRST